MCLGVGIANKAQFKIAAEVNIGTAESEGGWVTQCGHGKVGYVLLTDTCIMALRGLQTA